MDILIFLLGALGMIGCIPVALIKLFKKQSKKKVGITFLVSFALFVVSLCMPSSNGTDPAITQTPIPTITNVEEQPSPTEKPAVTLKPTDTPVVKEVEIPTPEPTTVVAITATSTPVPTDVPIVTTKPTQTPIPEFTVTPEPTATSTPAPTVTPSPKPTNTPVLTPTNTPTPSPKPTTTPVPTNTPKPEPTNTPVPTNTPTPTVKPEDSSICKSFSVTYLDVGQGDAAVVECNGHYMLIDGGDKGYSDLMYSYLKSNGIKTLDIVVATHAHSDHVGGLAGALNYAKTNLVLCPVTENDTKAFNDFKKYAEKNGPGITIPKIGDKYKLGSAEIEILGLNAGTENDSSIILTVTLGDNCFLFTGDAERDGELAVLDKLDLPETVILKVGHHGSDTSSTYQFLREVMPTYAIISCGTGNSYGHPTDATLSKLRDADSIVYRTDLNGDIVFGYDGTQWYVGYEKEASYEEIMTPADGLTNIPEQPEEPEPDSSSTAGRNYIGNKNSKVFHYTDCSSVKRMNESNKVYFNNVTRDEVISKGYKPCGNCNP